MPAPICKECKTRPAQTNYIKDGQRHYRSKCYTCNHKKILVTNLVPGYKKKSKCERCGFLPRIPDQLQLHYADHNTQNTNFKNLRTVCCNCAVEISTLKLPWTTGDLVPDF